jgi:hypothetical protein
LFNFGCFTILLKVFATLSVVSRLHLNVSEDISQDLNSQGNFSLCCILLVKRVVFQASLRKIQKEFKKRQSTSMGRS